MGYRIAYIEDYSLKIAKKLLQGVDLWLNTPIRLNEASGTSGMKASMNFIPNLSILDGWWVEGYNGKNGWAINPKNEQEDDQDWLDAKSLYNILEKEIIPLYYEYDPYNIPFDWVTVMREAAKTTLANFSSRRMLKEYVLKFYVKMLNSDN